MPAQRHLCIHSTRRRAGNSHARGTASTGGKEGERGRGEGRGAVVAGEQTREAEQASRSLLRQRKDGNRAQAGMTQMERETQSLEPQLINAVLRKQHGATRSPRHCRSVTAGETGHQERTPQTTAPGGKGTHETHETREPHETRSTAHKTRDTQRGREQGSASMVPGNRRRRRSGRREPARRTRPCPGWARGNRAWHRHQGGERQGGRSAAPTTLAERPRPITSALIQQVGGTRTNGTGE